MKAVINLILDNYNVSVTTTSEEVAMSVNDVLLDILHLTNPREILSSIESIEGVESTIIKNPQTNEVLLSSGLLSPEE